MGELHQGDTCPKCGGYDTRPDLEVQFTTQGLRMVRVGTICNECDHSWAKLAQRGEVKP